MKRHATLFCIAMATLAAAPVFATVHSHEGAGHGASARLAFDHGRKWATDEPLRRHMGEIRNVLARHGRAILAGTLGDAEARALGVQIESRVASIVAECKLPAEADANLHLVVADLMRAADILQGRTKHKPQQGTALASRATQMYATYFDHPGWKPVHEDSLTFRNAPRPAAFTMGGQ